MKILRQKWGEIIQLSSTSASWNQCQTIAHLNDFAKKELKVRERYLLIKTEFLLIL